MADDRGDASFPDACVADLARLFRTHPAWQRAARHVRDGATSDVYFSHRPGERWHLARERGVSLLRPGPAADPDFVFRFTPGAVKALAAVEGGVGDFAVCLFERMLRPGDDHVDLRLVSPLLRLARNGYVGLLYAAGPRVAAFGARHGVRSPADLRDLVRRLRSAQPEPWEG